VQARSRSRKLRDVWHGWLKRGKCSRIVSGRVALLNALSKSVHCLHLHAKTAGSVRQLTRGHIQHRRRCLLQGVFESWSTTGRAARTAVADRVYMDHVAQRWAAAQRLLAWRDDTRTAVALARRGTVARKATRTRACALTLLTWQAFARETARHTEERRRHNAWRCEYALSRWYARLVNARRTALIEGNHRPERALCALLLRRVKKRMRALQDAAWLRRQGEEAALAAVASVRTLRLWAHALKQTLTLSRALDVENSSAFPASATAAAPTPLGAPPPSSSHIHIHRFSVAPISSVSSPPTVVPATPVPLPSTAQPAAYDKGRPSARPPLLPRVAAVCPIEPMLTTDRIFLALHTMQCRRLVNAALRSSACAAAFREWRRRWLLRAWEYRFLTDAHAVRDAAAERDAVIDSTSVPDSDRTGPARGGSSPVTPATAHATPLSHGMQPAKRAPLHFVPVPVTPTRSASAGTYYV
jgi:hypothetical protein